MPDKPDLRSQRLEWIRDGSNWLVGFAAGALVLSGTYFHDKFDKQASAVWLVGAWVLLTISILAGVFTYFSAWKDLRKSPEADVEEQTLGMWVRASYTVMMWAFLFGYLVLAVALIRNSLATKSSDDTVTITMPLSTKPQRASVLSGGQRTTVDVKNQELTLTISKK
jgi:hypothetical protein